MEKYPKITAQQWKQKLQFLLQGEDYNQKFIQKTHQEIDILPFYNDENTAHLPHFTTNIRPVFIDENKILKLKTNAEIEKFHTENQPYFLVEIPFINHFFQKNFPFETSKILVYDPIGNLSKTGNFYTNKNTDFLFWQEIFKKTQIIFIDGSFLSEAGASCIQQVAYIMAMLNEYISISENFSEKIKIIIKTTTEPIWYFEAAKIKAIRWILESIFPKNPIEIIVDKNKNLPFLNNVFLQELTITNSFLGNANFIISNEKFNEIIKNIDFFHNENWGNHHFYFKHSTYQIVQKSLNIWNDIEKSGGYLQQLKSHTLQKKIKEKAIEQKKYYQKNFTIYSKKTERKNNTKTLLEPILPINF